MIIKRNPASSQCQTSILFLSSDEICGHSEALSRRSHIEPKSSLVSDLRMRYSAFSDEMENSRQTCQITAGNPARSYSYSFGLGHMQLTEKYHLHFLDLKSLLF